MDSLFNFSSFWHGLAVFGVFLLNFLIYEFVCFGVYMIICMTITKYVKKKEVEERIFTTGMMIAMAIFMSLIILYAGDVYRLIPLP